MPATSITMGGSDAAARDASRGRCATSRVANAHANDAICCGVKAEAEAEPADSAAQPQ
eukprot:NODE_28156_length_487_cov_2.222222.p3 GENE.NODE_28156_length_487_cov_2.222222~~NODE_28156_length_487_cov_2.222222.p3  ORF type:complete len:58 (-),score=6.88 NODE_28156_length_487_cov_2.222222:246-419(-)